MGAKTLRNKGKMITLTEKEWKLILLFAAAAATATASSLLLLHSENGGFFCEEKRNAVIHIYIHAFNTHSLIVAVAFFEKQTKTQSTHETVKENKFKWNEVGMS